MEEDTDVNHVRAALFHKQMKLLQSKERAVCTISLATIEFLGDVFRIGLS